jgi:hypothetical protein
LSGGDNCSDLLTVRDCSPDDEELYIEPIVSTQSALLTRSALLTQSALHTQSKPILPGGRGKGSVSSDLTPHDDLNTGNHFITRFLRQTGITTPMDDCSQIPLVIQVNFLTLTRALSPSIHYHPASALRRRTRHRKYL